VPLYLCEGPFDALALLAGGIPTAAAVLGVTGVRAEWLAGVRRVVICFDADAAGQEGRADLAFAAAAGGADVELLPCSVLGDRKDLGEYWTAHRALPDPLVAHWRAAAAATVGVVPAIVTAGSCPPLPADCLAPVLCMVLGRCERAATGRCCVSTAVS
jgi:hypothetical protein